MGGDEIDRTVATLVESFSGPRVVLGEVLCDVHAGTAVEYDGPYGRRTLTYHELRERSAGLAATLRELGVTRGSRVAVMLPKSCELIISLVAIWRAGAVHVPLFTAFGPDAAEYRIRHSEAHVVVTDAGNRAKLSGIETYVEIVCVGGSDQEVSGRDHDFDHACERESVEAPVAYRGDDLFIMLYTSGTTGQPKGVEIPVRACASFQSYMVNCLDVRPEDVFWNISDPGWGYGLWFAVVGPLLLGQTMLLRGGQFDPLDALHAIVDTGVTNLTGAPTIYRAIRSAGGVPAWFRAGSRLRVASSAGEPLNPELLDWSERELGVAVHDHYGQSEVGMPVGFPHHPSLHRTPVPGSMGVSAPGYRVVVVDEQGFEAGPGVPGELAIDVAASPLYWFRGYFKDPKKTAERFRCGERYYVTGDSARVGEDGLLYFTSRADDVITSSGYRIGPFEVESALMAHPDVAEVAVIGTPDDLRGEAVTAFVVLGVSAADAGPALEEELQLFVKKTLSAHLFPRRVVFVDSLPRTPSGKIQRSVLRRQWHEAQVQV